MVMDGYQRPHSLWDPCSNIPYEEGNDLLKDQTNCFPLTIDDQNDLYRASFDVHMPRACSFGLYCFTINEITLIT